MILLVEADDDAVPAVSEIASSEVCEASLLIEQLPRNPHLILTETFFLVVGSVIQEGASHQCGIFGSRN